MFVYQDLGDDWIVEMRWRDGDYQGGPEMVVIRPKDEDSPPPGGISSTALRSIDFRAAKAQLQKQLSDRPHDRRGKTTAKTEEDRIRRLRDLLADGITREYLALLASDYVQRVNSDQPKPVERLADELGKSLQTVRGHLWQARTQGLLTGSPGRKGGDLTMEAMTLLQRMAKPRKDR
jgi:biotin operon repressor